MESKYKNIINVLSHHSNANSNSQVYIKVNDISKMKMDEGEYGKWKIYIFTNNDEKVFSYLLSYLVKNECESKFKELLEIWDKGIND